MSSVDVIVLGADIEGLVAAAALARAGRAVLLLEESDVVGGIAAGEEFHPGYRSAGVVHEVGCLRRKHLGFLELEQHGLAWDDSDAWTRLPVLQGADVEAFGRWREFVDRVRPWVNELVDSPAPEAAQPAAVDLLGLAKTGFSLRRLGERDMFELLRIASLPLADWMGECFEDQALRVALAAPALLGTALGPRAPGTAGLLLLRACLLGPEPRGGPAALADALAAACRRLGVDLRTGQRVARLRVEAGSVRGVELEGESIAAPRVLSTRSPGRTLLELVEPRHLSTSLEQVARNWRSRGSVAAIRWALSKPPELAERGCTAKSLNELEQSADHLKYGTMCEQPWLDVFVPSAEQASLAPKGHSVVTALIHGIPHRLEKTWNEDARSDLTTAALHELERVCPGVRETVVAGDLLTPIDLERRFGLDGGHLFQGELALDQLWIQRPAPRLARYATPIEGLYLCGSSSHPGGPFYGGAGALAARAVLATDR
jgi:phytoene dehydrogenase-like protein